MNQSIEDASRIEFEAKFDCTGLVYEKHSLSENMVYSPANAQISQSWTLANLRNNQWTAWQASRQSSQSEPVYQYYDDSSYGWNDCHKEFYDAWHEKKRIVYAAPQQAIPSGMMIIDIEIVDDVLNKAYCDCGHSMRYERGEHLASCPLFDLNIERYKLIANQPESDGK